MSGFSAAWLTLLQISLERIAEEKKQMTVCETSVRGTGRNLTGRFKAEKKIMVNKVGKKSLHFGVYTKSEPVPEGFYFLIFMFFLYIRGS